MTCALLTIGTELTRGELHDTNSGFLALRLTELGHKVTEICTVDDDDDRIVATLLRLSKVHQFVLCTGGLGPTTDDRTSACAATALGVALVRNSEAYDQLKRLMKQRGRPLTPASEKQADFPEGAQVLKNDHGTAPGFSVLLGECRLCFMPGVPGEMKPMFERGVVPLLPASQETIICHRLRTFGVPEVEINDRLAGIEDTFGLVLAYRASHSEIEVKILATAHPSETESSLQARSTAALNEVRARLGNTIYAEGTTSLAETLGQLLCARNLRLSLAESCTGGLASQLITAVPGASRYYLGGVCSYDNAIKERLLGVSSQTLREFGAVSQAVALEMAQGALNAFNADIALSFTGIAGPDGGSAEKPVGLVHWAVATKSGTSCFHQVFRGTRAEVQRRAALSGLWSVRNTLLAL